MPRAGQLVVPLATPVCHLVAHSSSHHADAPLQLLVAARYRSPTGTVSCSQSRAGHVSPPFRPAGSFAGFRLLPVARAFAYPSPNEGSLSLAIWTQGSAPARKRAGPAGSRAAVWACVARLSFSVPFSFHVALVVRARPVVRDWFSAVDWLFLRGRVRSRSLQSRISGGLDMSCPTW